jgi:hypothetical protein
MSLSSKLAYAFSGMFAALFWAGVVDWGHPHWFVSAGISLILFLVLLPDICPECGAGEIKTYTLGKDPTYCTNPHCPPKKCEHEVL